MFGWLPCVALGIPVVIYLRSAQTQSDLHSPRSKHFVTWSVPPFIVVTYAAIHWTDGLIYTISSFRIPFHWVHSSVWLAPNSFISFKTIADVKLPEWNKHGSIWLTFLKTCPPPQLRSLLSLERFTERTHSEAQWQIQGFRSDNNYHKYDLRSRMRCA